MPEGIDAGSFDFYEGIRILIPGAATLFVAEAALRTLSSDNTGFDIGSVPSLVLALLIGLLYYFIDLPKRSAIYSPLQPTDLLQTWGVRPTEGTRTINNYFVMLDSEIPPAIRARALYMGSMFRIGFELIYLLIVASVAVIALPAALNPAMKAELTTPRWEIVGLAVVLVVSMFVARARDHKPTALRPMADYDVKPRLDSRPEAAVCMLSAVATLVLLFAASRSDQVPALLMYAPVALPLGLWAIRYTSGYRGKGPEDADADNVSSSPSRQYRASKPKRHPIAACHAVLLLGVAGAQLALTQVSVPSVDPGLNSAERIGWLGVFLAAYALVYYRGHETRLRGAYMTQNTWLVLERDRITQRYFASDASRSGTDEPRASGWSRRLRPKRQRAKGTV